MKKPPLLPVLAFSAVLGAGIFLTLSMPSCGSRDGVVERDAPGEQRRAFVGAVQGDPEALRAAAAVVGKEKPDTRGPLAHGPARDAVEKGRVRACQRDFLADPNRWRPGEAQNAGFIALMHHSLEEAWIKSLLEPSSDAAAKLEDTAKAHRQLVDKVCADRSKLTPEAKEEWEQWEAKNWEGWALAAIDAGKRPDTSDQTAEEHVAAQDSAKFLEGMQRQLHTVEYLSDERDRCAAALAEMPKDGTSRAEYEAALAAAEDQLKLAKVRLGMVAVVGRYEDKNERRGKVLMVIDPDTADE